MKLLKNLFVALAFTAAAITASAQIHSVSGDGANLIIGAITSQSTFIGINGCQWSTVSNYSTVSSGTIFTAGVSSGGSLTCSTTNGLFQPLPALSHGSLRGTVYGEAFTPTAEAPETVTAHILTSTYTTTPVRIEIWGPTLNQYGVYGCQYFAWSISSSNGTTSGYGETLDTSGHYGYITVTITPYYYSYGDILIQSYE